MTNLLEQPTANSAAIGMAISRALAKARVGNAEALRWLIKECEAGNPFAARAVEEFRRAHAKDAATQN